MRLRPLLSAAALVALTATIVGAPATLAAGPKVRMVDDDGKAAVDDCKGTNGVASTIQAAVDASGPGDTILVCPGTYQEQVLVDGADGLTIQAVKPWTANVLSPAILEDPAWLMGIVDSQDVIVQWLRFSALATVETPPAALPPCENVDGVIAIVASTGVEVRSNHIGARGIHTLGMCGYDAGILLGDIGTVGAAVAGDPVPFPPASAKIVNNTITDFKIAGIAAIGLKTRFDIVQNSIRFSHANEPGDNCNGNTASAAAPKASSRLRQTVRTMMGPAGPGLPFGVDCFAFGVLDVLGTSGTIRYNEVWSNAVPQLIVDANPAPALLAGFVEWGQGPAVNLVNVDFPEQSDAPVLSGNRVRGAVAGYALIGADLVRLKDNAARFSGFGTFVSQTQNARVTDNRFVDDFGGIWVTDEFYAFFPDRGGSADNAFRRNDIPARASLDVSCVDETTGTGTLGTANEWTDNTAPADSSDPSGICGAAAP